jgi:hypothetical protein
VKVLTFDSCPTGIPEVRANSPFIFPNPFSTHFEIKAGIPLDNGRFTIVNALGEPVREITVSGEEHVIVQRGDLAPGIYFGYLSQQGSAKGHVKLVINENLQ